MRLNKSLNIAILELAHIWSVLEMLTHKLILTITGYKQWNYALQANVVFVTNTWIKLLNNNIKMKMIQIGHHSKITMSRSWRGAVHHSNRGFTTMGQIYLWEKLMHQILDIRQNDGLAA